MATVKLDYNNNSNSDNDLNGEIEQIYYLQRTEHHITHEKFSFHVYEIKKNKSIYFHTWKFT